MRLNELVQQFGGTLDGDGSLEITGVTGIEFAGPGDVTFAADDRSLAAAEASPAAAIIARRDARTAAGPGAAKPLIRCDSPFRYAADLLEFFHPLPRPEAGIHPTAVVDPTADVAPTASVGPRAVIGHRCRLAERVRIGPGACLGQDCSIGPDTILHPNVTLYRGTQVGARVILHAGCVLGADGFGYFPDGDGLRKWPHVGCVVVEDDVEIGANACIDRARFGVTLIECGAKIDNLVQVAHNCRVGRWAVLAGQAGLSGSVVLEEGATLAGQVGVADHVRIGRRATLAGQTGAMSDVPPESVYFGYPGKPHRQALEEQAMLTFLTKHRRAVRKLVREGEPESQTEPRP